MIYFSAQELDNLLLEDAYRGDLTSRAMGLNTQAARMQFRRKKCGRVAGVAVACALLERLNLKPICFAHDGEDVAENTLLLEVHGDAQKLHHGWKAAQLVLEWSCGVAQYTAEMINAAQAVDPACVLACTRKSIPYTRKLATIAVLAGGGHIHRQGLSETLLVFKNHRALYAEPDNYHAMVRMLRAQNPEHKITLEADNLQQLTAMLPAQPDIIQMDKFSLDDVKTALSLVQKSQSAVQLSLAGGVRRENIAEFARAGVRLFISSAPYYAKPQDIKVAIDAAD
ncbi:ModD protein [Pasteurellaceae bacterium HPA106]|uniref:ModD protein n=1 Tax=Spirabiliibacterium pneumoniae TaxID=221400 RepID=UPI001AAE1017|nr:ModD protein [Spirabiliibacterium pneumoniae]MBE2895843.1 ModD protein [Spirabiliibacterium pneumoniae]